MKSFPILITALILPSLNAGCPFTLSACINIINRRNCLISKLMVLNTLRDSPLGRLQICMFIDCSFCRILIPPLLIDCTLSIPGGMR